MSREGRVAVAFAVGAVLLVVLWQALTLHFNRDGNPTALFCTGAVLPVPPAFEGSTYRFPGTGYDGQFYRTIAHDPLFRHGLDRYVDDPRLRYRRILVPGLAFLLGGGHGAAVDIAFGAVVLALLGIGVYCVSRLALKAGRSPAWGLAFLLLPASIVSIDRMVVDGPLTVFVALYALGVRTERRGLQLAACALAVLTRETGLLLCAAATIDRVLRREWKGAVLSAASALPALAWYAFVHAHTAPQPYGAVLVPFRGIVESFLHPSDYAGKAALVVGLNRLTDRLALVGIAAAILAALRGLRPSHPPDPVRLAGALFAITAVLHQRADVWLHVFDFGRIYSPMLLVLGLEALRRGSAREVWFMPLLYPRILMQLGSQLAGVVLGLARLAS